MPSIVDKLQALKTNNTKIHNLIQTHAGNKVLSNPLTRITIKGDPISYKLHPNIYDCTTETINDGKHHELLEFNVELLDAQNVHLIKPKSNGKGVVSFSQ